MISQMHGTDKYSQHSSIIYKSVWLNGSVFSFELSGCGLESCYSQSSIFYSEEVKFLILTFYLEKDDIRNTRLISKFVHSQSC